MVFSLSTFDQLSVCRNNVMKFVSAVCIRSRLQLSLNNIHSVVNSSWCELPKCRAHQTAFMLGKRSADQKLVMGIQLNSTFVSILIFVLSFFIVNRICTSMLVVWLSHTLSGWRTWTMLATVVLHSSMKEILTCICWVSLWLLTNSKQMKATKKGVFRIWFLFQALCRASFLWVLLHFDNFYSNSSWLLLVL